MKRMHGAAITLLGENSVPAADEIHSGRDLSNQLRAAGTKVHLFYVEMGMTLPNQIPYFPGMMKIHQLCADASGEVLSRELNCYCCNVEQICDTVFYDYL